MHHDSYFVVLIRLIQNLALLLLFFKTLGRYISEGFIIIIIKQENNEWRIVKD